jgi:hypothetical protein
MAIGNQLRTEYSISGCPKSVPGRLLTLVRQLEEGEQTVPAQDTPVINPLDAEEGGAAILHFPTKTPAPNRQPSTRSVREMGELWKFEMLVLSLLESNLAGHAREIATRKLATYFRVCHAALQSGEISDRDAEVLRRWWVANPVDLAVDCKVSLGGASLNPWKNL